MINYLGDEKAFPSISILLANSRDISILPYFNMISLAMKANTALILCKETFP